MEENQIIRKEGQMAIPKNYPILKSEIVSVGKDMDGSPLYLLGNGGRYTEIELEPCSEKA